MERRTFAFTDFSAPHLKSAWQSPEQFAAVLLRAPVEEPEVAKTLNRGPFLKGSVRPRSGASATLPPRLIRPRRWHALLQSAETDAWRFVSLENPLDDLRGERRKPQNAADISAVNAVGRSQILEARVFPRFKLLLPVLMNVRFKFPRTRFGEDYVVPV